MAKATTAVVSVALAGAMLLPALSTTAQAGPRGDTYIEQNNNTYIEQNFYNERRREHRRHKNKNKINTGEAVAIGVIGLAAGVILGEALSGPDYVAPAPRSYQPPRPAYHPPRPAAAYQPPVVAYNPPPSYPAPQPVYAAPQPWSPAWFAYCTKKYRSFNPNTGTYRTYSGKNRFCQ